MNAAVGFSIQDVIEGPVVGLEDFNEEIVEKNGEEIIDENVVFEDTNEEMVDSNGHEGCQEKVDNS